MTQSNQPITQKKKWLIPVILIDQLEKYTLFRYQNYVNDKEIGISIRPLDIPKRLGYYIFMEGGEMNMSYCYDCRHNVSFPTVPHTVNNGTMMHKIGKAVKDGETRELRKTHKKSAATWELCAGVTNDGIYGHSMRDNCYNCAPFWEVYPVCPNDKKALSANGYCKVCRKHFDLSVRPTAKEMLKN